MGLTWLLSLELTNKKGYAPLFGTHPFYINMVGALPYNIHLVRRFREDPIHQ